MPGYVKDIFKAMAIIAPRLPKERKIDELAAESKAIYSGQQPAPAPGSDHPLFDWMKDKLTEHGMGGSFESIRAPVAPTSGSVITRPFEIIDLTDDDVPVPSRSLDPFGMEITSISTVANPERKIDFVATKGLTLEEVAMNPKLMDKLSYRVLHSDEDNIWNKGFPQGVAYSAFLSVLYLKGLRLPSGQKLLMYADDGLIYSDSPINKDAFIEELKKLGLEVSPSKCK